MTRYEDVCKEIAELERRIKSLRVEKQVLEKIAESDAFKKNEQFSIDFGDLGPGDYVFLHSKIPEKKLKGAMDTYYKGKEANEIFVLIDDTVFGGAREGFVISKSGVYGKSLGEAPFEYSWKIIRSLNSIEKKLYINDVLVQKLSLIDVRRLQLISYAAQKYVEYTRVNVPEVNSPKSNSMNFYDATKATNNSGINIGEAEKKGNTENSRNEISEYLVLSVQELVRTGYVRHLIENVYRWQRELFDQKLNDDSSLRMLSDDLHKKLPESLKEIVSKNSFFVVIKNNKRKILDYANKYSTEMEMRRMKLGVPFPVVVFGIAHSYDDIWRAHEIFADIIRVTQIDTIKFLKEMDGGLIEWNRSDHVREEDLLSVLIFIFDVPFVDSLATSVDLFFQLGLQGSINSDEALNNPSRTDVEKVIVFKTIFVMIIFAGYIVGNLLPKLMTVARDFSDDETFAMGMILAWMDPFSNCLSGRACEVMPDLEIPSELFQTIVMGIASPNTPARKTFSLNQFVENNLRRVGVPENQSGYFFEAANSAVEKIEKDILGGLYDLSIHTDN